MRFNLITLPLLIIGKLSAQFAGPVGTPNTNAMHADSSAFVGWGSQCKVQRGPQDISNLSLGNTTVGDSSMATGKAGVNGIVSLGDGGSAVVTFSAGIANGPGYDFAVFENSFSDTFLELTFVEVSSDGLNFFRFPATSNSTISPQFDNNASMDASKLNNLAGKYRNLYGTPFDLQELAGNSQLDINNITHVKIIDVVGSVSPGYARYDMNNNAINDPWPTPFNSSGFDLDAVGVIHQAAVGVQEYAANLSVSIYPNPSSGKLNVNSSQLEELTTSVYDITGKELLNCVFFNGNGELNLIHFSNGIYFLRIKNDKGIKTFKIVKE